MRGYKSAVIHHLTPVFLLLLLLRPHALLVPQHKPLTIGATPGRGCIIDKILKCTISRKMTKKPTLQISSLLPRNSGGGGGKKEKCYHLPTALFPPRVRMEKVTLAYPHLHDVEPLHLGLVHGAEGGGGVAN